MAKSADAFRTISEVADWLDTPAHVLRFWESKFSQVKPVKRAGGRRYYRPNDMLLLGGIKKLLHSDGMTIKGVQKLLREQGVKHVVGHSPPLGDVIDAKASDTFLDAEEPATVGATGTVVNFQRDAEAAAASAEVTEEPPQPDMSETPPSTTEEPAERIEKSDDLPSGDETPSPVTSNSPAEVGEETPVLPSFAHHRAQETEHTDAGEDAKTPASTLKPANIEVPDDPVDDIAAEHGMLSQLVALPRPVPKEFADRLKPILDRMRQTHSD